jgi:serine/threonine protein kinase
LRISWSSKSYKKAAGADAEKARILSREHSILIGHLKKRDIPQGIGLIEMVAGVNVALQLRLEGAPIERFGNGLKKTRMIHQNICRLFDLGGDKGTYFIAMEYFPGEDLKSFVRSVGRRLVGKAISIARQICPIAQVWSSHHPRGCQLLFVI